MGVFADQRYEELDWISKATEPIESKLNELLGNLQTEVTLDINMILEVLGVYTNNIGIQKDDIIRGLAKENFPHIHGEQEILLNCFSLEIADDTIIDFESNIILGSIVLKKIKNTIEDSDLKNVFGTSGMQMLNWLSVNAANMFRANEVLEILGKCDDALRSKSGRVKRKGLINRMKQILSNNEWNIKDLELSNKVGRWICEYIEDGNLASFRDLCRLKVMTHRGLPIYSMEDIE